MPSLPATMNRLLRDRELPGRDTLPFASLCKLLVVSAALYGVAMGTYAGIGHERIAQLLISSTKLPLFFLLTFTLTLPPFCTLNLISGVGRDLASAVRILFATQAALCVILGSLSPVTVFWYLSISNYTAAILFNGLIFAAATGTSGIVLVRFYRPLIRSNRVHAWLLGAWLVLYMFVGIQMGWVLRPFIGSPDRPVEWVRHDMWGNAYVEILRLGRRLVYETDVLAPSGGGASIPDAASGE